MIEEEPSWTLPFTPVDDILSVEMAKRSRFESDSVIRFLNPDDDSDKLYELPKNSSEAVLISHVKITNPLKSS